MPSSAAIKAVRALAVIGHLERRGCTVLEATSHADQPVIRITPPPPGAIESWGYREPPPLAVRQPVLCVANVFHARVEWISKETRR